MITYDPKHAPDHAVKQLAANWPPPPRSPRPPTAEAWQAMIRTEADRIWREAFTAGTVHGLGLQLPQPMLLVTAEEQAAIVERFAKKEDRADV